MATTPRTARRGRAPVPRQAIRRRFLVATTGEPESRGALRFTAALSEQFTNASVLALGVSIPFPHNVSTLLSLKQGTTIDEESRREVLDTVRHAIAHVPGAEAWEKMALVGTPPEEINRVAESWGATMLILGLGRHNRLDRIFGSETAVEVMTLSSQLFAVVIVIAAAIVAGLIVRGRIGGLDMVAALRTRE